MATYMERKPAVRLAARSAYGWSVGGLILAVYLAVFIILPRGAFYSPDSGGKYLQMLGYYWNDGLQSEIIYPGAALDPEHLFHGNFAAAESKNTTYPYRSETGTVRTGWTPWFSLLVRPFYRLGGVPGLHFVPWAAGLLLVMTAGVLAKRLRHGSGPAAMAIVGLASPVLFYSLCFWEHTMAVWLVLAALTLILQMYSETGSAGARTVAGCTGMLLMLAACALRRELVLFVGGGILAWGWLHPRRGRVLSMVLPALLLVGTAGVLLLLVQPAPLLWLFPSSVKDVGWMHSLLTIGFWREYIPNLIRIMFLDDYDVLISRPVLGAGLLGLILCLGSPWAPRQWRRPLVLTGAALISIPAAALVFTRVRYRALSSLFLPAPLALFALLPSVKGVSLARRWLGWTIVFFLALFSLVSPAAEVVHGGLEWGGRYTLVAIVLLNVLGVLAFMETRRDATLSVGMKWAVSLLAAWLVFLGAASSLRGVHELRHTRRDLLALQATLEHIGDPVVTDVWWLSACLTPFASAHEVYTVSERHPLEEWLLVVGPQRPRFTLVTASPPQELPGDAEKHRLRKDGPFVAGQFITHYTQH